MEEKSKNKKHLNFFDLFPPPKFLTRLAVGLHISDDDIRFVEFVKSEHGFALGRYGKKVLPVGLITGGVISNMEEAKKTLRQISKEFGFTFVNATLPEEKVYLFKTQIPRMEYSAIYEALEFHIEENVPISLLDAVFDYCVIRDDPLSEHIDISVIVADRKIVESYLSLIRESGMEPLSLCVPSEAIIRAAVARESKETILVVNMLEDKTFISIASDGAVQFTSSLTRGGNVITEAIEKHFSIKSEDAFKMKSDKDFMKGKKDEQFSSFVLSAFKPLKDEIARVLVYWNTNKFNTEKQVVRILLSGSDMALPGLDEYVSTSVGVSAKLVNVWENCFGFDAYVPPIPFEASLDYAVAIGLGFPRVKQDSQ